MGYHNGVSCKHYDLGFLSNFDKQTSRILVPYFKTGAKIYDKLFINNFKKHIKKIVV
jgi:hypothetical protein